MSNFYIYEFIRLDYNEPFYIGKGSGNRWKELRRVNNKHFNSIVKNIPIAVNILHSGLDEKTAYEYEIWYIWQLRDIQGYSLVNISDGGEGGPTRLGIKLTTKQKEKISNSLKGKLVGENNPFYGCNHSDETKSKLAKAWTEDRKRIASNSMLGDKNPSSKEVLVINSKGDIIKRFSCISDMCNSEWRFQFPRPNGINYITRDCLKKGKLFHGYKLIYKGELNEPTGV